MAGEMATRGPQSCTDERALTWKPIEPSPTLTESKEEAPSDAASRTRGLPRERSTASRTSSDANAETKGFTSG